MLFTILLTITLPNHPVVS